MNETNESIKQENESRRYDMKKHALTAVALTAALALGAVPAFAATPTGSVGELQDRTLANNGTTGTTVKVETTVSQIVASLPIDMTIAAPTAGGTTAVPGANAYKIINKSIFPIKVSAAKTDVVEGWKLQSAAQTTTTKPTGTIGDIQMTITSSDNKAWNIAGAYTADLWKIPAKIVDGKDGELTFDIAATNSPLKKTFSSATKAVTLTYTVAADDMAPVK